MASSGNKVPICLDEYNEKYPDDFTEITTDEDKCTDNQSPERNVEPIPSKRPPDYEPKVTLENASKSSEGVDIFFQVGATEFDRKRDYYLRRKRQHKKTFEERLNKNIDVYLRCVHEYAKKFNSGTSSNTFVKVEQIEERNRLESAIEKGDSDQYAEIEQDDCITDTIPETNFGKYLAKQIEEFQSSGSESDESSDDCEEEYSDSEEYDDEEEERNDESKHPSKEVLKEMVEDKVEIDGEMMGRKVASESSPTKDQPGESDKKLQPPDNGSKKISPRKLLQSPAKHCIDIACAAVKGALIITDPVQLDKLKRIYLRTIHHRGFFEEDFDLDQNPVDPPKHYNTLAVLFREEQPNNHLDFGVFRHLFSDEIETLEKSRKTINMSCIQCQNEFLGNHANLISEYKPLETDVFNNASYVIKSVKKVGKEEFLVFGLIKEVTERVKIDPNIKKRSRKCKRNQKTVCLRKVQAFFSVDTKKSIESEVFNLAVRYHDLKDYLFSRQRDVDVFFHIAIPPTGAQTHHPLVYDGYVYVIKLKLVKSPFMEKIIDWVMCLMMEYDLQIYFKNHFDLKHIDFQHTNLIPQVYVNKTWGTQIGTRGDIPVYDFNFEFYNQKLDSDLNPKKCLVAEMTPMRSDNGILIVKVLSLDPDNCYNAMILNSGFCYRRVFPQPLEDYNNAQTH